MVNKISPWIIDKLSNNKNEFFIDEITDNKEGLTVKVSDNNGLKVEIVWSHEKLVSYRNTNESYFLFGLGQLTERLQLRKNFYIIQNSEYVKFIEEWGNPETIDITSELIHFAIYTSEDCLDIIATYNPIIKVGNVLN